MGCSLDALLGLGPDADGFADDFMAVYNSLVSNRRLSPKDLGVW